VTVIPDTAGIRRLGLLGGTFDPIHEGHLALADYAAYHAGLDRVWFIPSATPPHKRRSDLADAAIRFEMTRAAVEPYAPRFAATDIELQRDGPSYTVETLRQIRDAVGCETELFWIVGRDNLDEIPQWYQSRRIVEYVTIIAGGRPGERVPDDLPDWFCARLLLLDGPTIDVSSTRIREQAASGVIDLMSVPEPVARIIQSRGLYGYTAPNTTA